MMMIAQLYDPSGRHHSTGISQHFDNAKSSRTVGHGMGISIDRVGFELLCNGDICSKHIYSVNCSEQYQLLSTSLQCHSRT